MTSQNFASKSGSEESLKTRVKWGLISFSLQTRCTVALETPNSRAMARQVQRHARRKFFQAVELNPKDQSAIGIVAQIDKLFKVDRQARDQGLTTEARHALRIVNSEPLLEEIRSRI